MDWSGHGKEASERGALTDWRAQKNGLVRTWKGSERAKGTHFLESAEECTGQDMEMKRASEGHSLPGERRRMDWSGHGKEANERGVLTDWRAQRNGLVRGRKGSE
jgi:hypothetical protein